jgi:hypothetical protein
LKTLVAEVSPRALKAVWYVKWFVHRHLRPEEYGGLVHMNKTHQASYPLHNDILHSDAVARTFAKHDSYFLSHGFPESCPQHPCTAMRHFLENQNGFVVCGEAVDGIDAREKVNTSIRT